VSWGDCRVPFLDIQGQMSTRLPGIEPSLHKTTVSDTLRAKMGSVGQLGFSDSCGSPHTRANTGSWGNWEFPVEEMVRKTQLTSEKEIPII
jgi:hypothetical protein